ncbi:CAP domain-containing protein [Rhodobacteraceae bacterium]|nr:CAP domain-containing protein [Paracoccaceae bacterium]
MIAFLYALLAGGVFAMVGGGSSDDDDETAVTPANTTPNDPAPTDPAPAIFDQVVAPQDDITNSDDDNVVVQDDNIPADDDNTPAQPDSAPFPDLPDDAFDIGWAGLTAEEQLIVELVNRARLDPLDEVDRLSVLPDFDESLASGVSAAPTQALAVTSALSNAARDHSEDMDDRNFFAHENLDGQSPSARAIEAGHGSRFVGENIGWIGSTQAPDEQERAEDHHANLWESDGHQRNLLDEDWSEIGVGYDYGDHTVIDDEGRPVNLDESTFATQLFGDRGDTYLTGVVIDDADDDAFYDIGEGQGGVQITAYDGDDVFTTATWEAGGYSLALPNGTYRVVFDGGDLDTPYETDVTIGDENVKLDVIDSDGAVMATLEAGQMLPNLSLESAGVRTSVLSSPEVDAEDDIFEMV